ncbi:hypothetical protein KIPB_014911, partial [Kipferlia bialata]|eukprot:g14911.t1
MADPQHLNIDTLLTEFQ